MSSVVQKKPLSYIPSLDGMRSVFCVMVIITHWPLALPVLPFGWEGLQAFFVSSGFLITRILLVQKEKHATFGSYVRSFYMRRTLRIFPLYFIYLFAMLLVRFLLSGNSFVDMYTKEIAHDWLFYFTYTSNLKSLFASSYGDTPFFMHLWSLGLEEQFYLFVPFMVFFFKEKWLKVAVVAIILLPFITRPLGYYFLLGMKDDVVWASVLSYRNLPFQCDAFALGAAIAVFRLDFIQRPLRWFAVLFTIYCALIVMHYPLFMDYAPYIMEHFKASIDFGNMGWFAYLNSLGHPEILPMGGSYNYMLPIANLLCFFLVLSGVRNKAPWPKLFESDLVVRIGKLSYAIYIFHFGFIIVFIKATTAVLGTGYMQINPLLHIPLFLVYLVILYFMAEFSYRYIETPFLKIKSKY